MQQSNLQKRMTNKEKDANYLDFVFERNVAISHETTDSGRVVLLCKHTGFFAGIAQKVFNKPEVTKVELDETGSFVWCNIDGQINVYEIGLRLKEQFGDKAEPLYERLTEFMRQLSRLGFIKNSATVRK